MSPYHVITEKEDNGAERRHQDAMEIQAGDADVAEDVEQPAPYDRAYNAEKNVQYDSFAAMIYQVAGNESRYKTEQYPHEQRHKGLLFGPLQSACRQQAESP